MPTRAIPVWLPVLTWALVIFVFSSIPRLGTGLGFWDLVLRKLAHTFEYAVLGFLLARALESQGLAFSVGAGYAVTDELHQSLVPGREAALLDVGVDSLGVAIGLAAHRVFVRRSTARLAA